MGRLSNLAARLGVAGAVALVAGTTMIVGAAVQTLTSPAFADSGQFELFCTNTPIGSLAFNDIVITGSLSPAAPAAGQQFNVTNFQAQVPIPANVAQAAAAVGNSSLSGTVLAGLTATGATPASIPTGSLPYDVAIPNPIPPAGITLLVPSSPATIGPFTATSSNIQVALASVVTLNFNDAAFNFPLPPISCSPYPNNVVPSGSAQAIPPGLPVAPVIATAGTVTTPPPSALTGPYELYCPHTPVGDLVFNDVVTSAAVSPTSLSAGDTFHVSGYQTHIPLPAGLAAAAVGLGNNAFNGLAASAVDAYGASPARNATGSMGFDVPIPNPVPSSGLGIDLPASPTTLGSFTASGGPITIAQDQSLLVVAELSSKAFKMSCTAFPNDSVATSGSTGVAPSGNPIRPIIAVASASGTPSTTTTSSGFPIPGGPNSTVPPGQPFELYCPGTPIGDLAINDTTISASLSPSTLTQGDQFQLSNLQMAFSLPQSVVQQAEGLGLTHLSGDISLFPNSMGAEGGGGFIGVATSSGSGTSVGSLSVPTTIPPGSGGGGGVIIGPGPPFPGPPFPGPPFPPFPGLFDLSFDVSLPTPVPSGGVQFTATPVSGSTSPFVAIGGPIQISVGGFNLNVTAFGNHFGLFCNSYANNSEPTGIATSPPQNFFVQPVVATGSATIPPPPPPLPGGLTGPYELFCPGTPVGSIVLNGVTTSATLSPANPAAGQQFEVTGYQTNVTIPPQIAGAAAALGNNSIMGSATTTVDAVGATPSSIPSGPLTFNVPIPQPVPTTGLVLTVPSPAGTVGPFTASTTAITISEDSRASLSLTVSGSQLALSCTAYPNNAAPTGITTFFPRLPPISPVIATAGEAATASGDITKAFDTLFNFADPSVASKVAVIQNGASVQTALSEALSSSIASSATGARVDSIAFLDDATCAQRGITSPCAQVTYDILGQGGSAILPNSQGYAVNVNGTWLVATPTICGLLQLFYQTIGKSGSPPGCPASGGITPGSPGSPPPTTPTVSPTGSGPPTTQAPGTTSQSTDTTTPTPTTTQAPGPGTAGNSADPSATSTTLYPVTGGSGSSTSGASGGVTASASGAGSGTSSGAIRASTVTASSRALAFTGTGPVMGWLLVVGAALVVLGLAMLVLADAPRRLWGALSYPSGPRRRLGDVGAATAGRDEVLWHDVLWSTGSGRAGGSNRPR